MNIDQNTFYWLFSTIPQTYGAIVGVLGLLIVYRLQNERDIRVELRTVVLPVLAEFSQGEAYGWSARKIVLWYFRTKVTAELIYDRMKGERITFMGKEQWGVTRGQSLEIIHLLQRMGHSADYALSIRGAFKSFVGYHLVLIIAFFTAIYLVPLGEWYSKQNDYVLNMSLLVSIGIALVAMGIVSFKLSWSLALSVIDGSQEWAEKQAQGKEVNHFEH